MGQLPNNDIPWNRAHLTQKQTATAQEKGQEEERMFISITQIMDSEPHAAIINQDREEFENEDLEVTGEKVLAHEPMFGKPESEYDTGEAIIEAIARSAGLDDESPGSALERLVKQVFILGVAHGVATERARIIARVAGE